MLLFNNFVIGIGILILILFTFLLKKYKNKSNIYILFFNIFGLYILYVLKYTFFPIPISSEVIQMYKQAYTESGVVDLNIIPFYFKFNDYFSESNFLNILLSLPFGFGISYIVRINLKGILMLAVAFGLFIEILQGIISLILGYTYRSIDINDVIFNFVGVVLGYIIFRFFSWIVIRIYTKKSDNSFMDYLYDVAKR